MSEDLTALAADAYMYGFPLVTNLRPPADTSNWLPAPAAPFRPILRIYQPRAAALDGGYRLPPITKARA
jgi:hypothetical protein